MLRALRLGGLCALALTTGSLHAATFRGLGYLTSDNLTSAATAVSGDGTRIVGAVSSFDGQYSTAVYWDQDGIAVPLDVTHAGLGAGSVAKSVSADGSVVVGYIDQRSASEQPERIAFYWTANKGIQPLSPPAPVFSATADDISGDGQWIVGTVQYADFTSEAVRWSVQGVTELLGALPTPVGPTSSYGSAITRNGEMIVGISTGDPSTQAVTWTQETGMVSLLTDNDSITQTSAEGVSSDGRTIVGSGVVSYELGGAVAYRWRSGVGLELLDHLHPSTIGSSALTVSPDGRVVFGVTRYFTETGSIAGDYFVWDSAHGVRQLAQALAQEHSLASDIAGWQELRATSVSDDGLTIVGAGINPQGRQEAWVARLDQPFGVPEPATSVMLLAIASIAWAANHFRAKLDARTH